VDLIRASRDLPDGAHGGMQHHSFAGSDAQAAKITGELPLENISAM
jgi:hypothetical protein